jgi:hypothetical protein
MSTLMKELPHISDEDQLDPEDFEDAPIIIGDASVTPPNPIYRTVAVTPPNPAESLFLAGLATSAISADALSDQIKSSMRNPRKNSFSSAASATTAQTDDYHTAAESPDDLDEDQNNYSVFGRDVLLYSRESIPELTQETDRDLEMSTATANMTPASTATKKAPVATAAPTTKTPEKQVDAATHVYDGAKGAWAWGKGVMVFKPFLGIAEAVAGKAAGIVGTSLEEIDTKIKPKLGDLDHGVLNPAVEAVLGIVMNAFGKAEGIVKPIILVFLKPLGLIKENEGAPEVTASKK